MLQAVAQVFQHHEQVLAGILHPRSARASDNGAQWPRAIITWRRTCCLKPTKLGNSFHTVLRRQSGEYTARSAFHSLRMTVDMAWCKALREARGARLQRQRCLQCASHGHTDVQGVAQVDASGSGELENPLSEYWCVAARANTSALPNGGDGPHTRGGKNTADPTACMHCRT